MRKRHVLLTVALAGVLAVCGFGAAVAQEGALFGQKHAAASAEYKEGEVLVVFESADAPVTANAAAKFAAKPGAKAETDAAADAGIAASVLDGLGLDLTISDSWTFEDVDLDILADDLGTGEGTEPADEGTDNATAGVNSLQSAAPQSDTAAPAAAAGEGDVEIALVTSESMSTDEMLAVLQDASGVAYAAPNYKRHATDLDLDDTYAAYQWALENNGQNCGTAGLDVNPDSIWNDGVTGSDDAIIVINDTGIDYNLDEFAGRMWENPYQPQLAGTCGYDFANGDDDPLDDHGHGTHCAGIAGATGNNGLGISGVNQHAKFMAVKYLNADGSGYDDTGVAAYNYIYRAMKLGVNVVAINNSWGGEGDTGIYDYLFDLVGQLGAVSVVAAGNETMDIDDPDNEGTVCPAQTQSDYAIIVAASNENDELAKFSNYGAESVDVAAPGADILSTVCYDCFNPTIYTDEQKATLCYNYQGFDGFNLWNGEAFDVFGQNIDADETTDPAEGEGLEGDPVVGDPSEGEGLEGDPVVGDPADDSAALPYSVHLYRDGKALDLADFSGTAIGVTDAEGFGLADGTGSCGSSLEIVSSDMKAYDFLTVEIPYTQSARTNAAVFSAMMKYQGYYDIEEYAGYCGIIDVDAATAVTDPSVAEEACPETLFGIGDRNNYWRHFLGAPSGTSLDRKLVIYLYCTMDCTAAEPLRLLADDIAVSADVPSSQFGTYDFYNGTSMATPCVTGAVALVRAAMVEDGEEPDALDVIARITSSVRPSESLAGYVNSGGVLDLSVCKEISQLKPRIKAVRATEDGTGLEVVGTGFSGGDISVTLQESGSETVTEATVESVSDDGKSLVLDNPEYLDKLVTVTVQKGADKSVKQGIYTATGELYSTMKEAEVDEDGFIETEDPEICAVTTNGTSMYGVSNMDQALYRYYPKGEFGGGDPEFVQEKWITDYKKLFSMEVNKASNVSFMFGKDLVYLDGQFFIMGQMAETSTIYETIGNDFFLFIVEAGEAVYYSETKLLKLDDSEIGAAAFELPEGYQHTSGGTLAAYNGKLYLIGGYDFQTKAMSTKVFVYDPVKSTWSESPAALPSGRADGRALQVGNKLVYTLGLSVDGSCPKNLVFDGTAWTESAAELAPYSHSSQTINGVAYNLYDCNIGLCKDGIQYLGYPVSGLGDSFTYSVSADSFAKGSYHLVSSFKNGEPDLTFTGTVVGSKVYGLDSGMCERSAATTSGLVKVTGATSKYGKITANKKAYLPGSKATVTAKANAGHYLTSFTVKGSKATYTAKPTKKSQTVRVTGDTKASATFGHYVTKITTPKATYSVKAGKKITIKPTVSPSNATNKKVTFKSSNKKYATVSTAGVVKAKRAGKGHSVTITIASADGHAKKSVKVNITK